MIHKLFCQWSEQLIFLSRFYLGILISSSDSTLRREYLTAHWLNSEGTTFLIFHVFHMMNSLSMCMRRRIPPFVSTGAISLRFINGKHFATGVQKAQTSSSQNDGDSNFHDKKESGQWSGKNAWKLAALSLAATTAFAAGFGISQWGILFS